MGETRPRRKFSDEFKRDTVNRTGFAGECGDTPKRPLQRVNPNTDRVQPSGMSQRLYSQTPLKLYRRRSTSVGNDSKGQPLIGPGHAGRGAGHSGRGSGHSG